METPAQCALKLCGERLRLPGPAACGAALSRSLVGMMASREVPGIGACRWKATSTTLIAAASTSRSSYSTSLTLRLPAMSDLCPVYAPFFGAMVSGCFRISWGDSN